MDTDYAGQNNGRMSFAGRVTTSLKYEIILFYNPLLCRLLLKLKSLLLYFTFL